jgi:tetratricopeptide (TPR) repeat protein
VAAYYEQLNNFPAAITYGETAVALAVSTADTKMHCQGLCTLAKINNELGNYSKAQAHAFEAQRLARICGDLYREAQALSIAGRCCYEVGNYNQSISLSNRARDLLSLCSMSGGDLDHSLMFSQAEIHRLKSEYIEARKFHV